MITGERAVFALPERDSPERNQFNAQESALHRDEGRLAVMKMRLSPDDRGRRAPDGRGRRPAAVGSGHRDDGGRNSLSMESPERSVRQRGEISSWDKPPASLRCRISRARHGPTGCRATRKSSSLHPPLRERPALAAGEASPPRSQAAAPPVVSTDAARG